MHAALPLKVISMVHHEWATIQWKKKEDGMFVSVCVNATSVEKEQSKWSVTAPGQTTMFQYLT